MALLKPSRALRRILWQWPGRERFGVYRFLPIFFVIGAILEFSMIKWHAGDQGQVNFYTTFKRRRAQELAAQDLYQEKIQQENSTKES